MQVAGGPHEGGIAGWLDADGRPEFVYLEITGYYLTAMAWLAGGAAGSDERRERALERGRRALAWMRSVTTGGAVPPTRLYLEGGPEDWRNDAIFTFDLAMAARGAACFAAVDGDGEGDAVVRELGARVEEIWAHAELLPSHALRNGAELPERWSTRPGPHHIKAAAALLRLPEGVLSSGLIETCRETVTRWESALRSSWPVSELHPLLYGVEGLLMQEPAETKETLDSVEQILGRLMQLQREDGSLPAVVDGGAGDVRSDVLAQALRAGALLRTAGRLRDADWTRRLNALAAALLPHVREDGAVRFASGQDRSNAWCAMFAHQALLMHAGVRTGELTGRQAAMLV